MRDGPNRAKLKYYRAVFLTLIEVSKNRHSLSFSPYLSRSRLSPMMALRGLGWLR